MHCGGKASPLGYVLRRGRGEKEEEEEEEGEEEEEEEEKVEELWYTRVRVTMAQNSHDIMYRV